MNPEISKPEYYFIAYAWTPPGGHIPWMVENTVIDQDPIQWVLDTEKSDCMFRLLFYRRITAEKFNKFNGRI